MKPRNRPVCFKSFQELKNLLDNRSLPSFKKCYEYNQELEDELFRRAMSGVKPILGKKRVTGVVRSKKIIDRSVNKAEEDEVIMKLNHLIKYGEGFNVASTPEYIEGTGYHVHPEIARRLHEGEFSIQAFVDLHGLRVEDAKETFDNFLKWATTTGKQGILIIHGRGLSSPSEPVLKRKVVEWLTKGQWRKWVIAFSSARKCDGGAGATYVLLRLRPITKRFKIKRF